MMTEGKLVYVATPYSHPETIVQMERFLTAADVTGWLMTTFTDYSFFSPITHTHPIAVRRKLPTGADFWIAYDRCILTRCQELWIVCMDGWRESKGIKMEQEIAAELGLKVKFVVPHAVDEWVVEEVGR